MGQCRSRTKQRCIVKKVKVYPPSSTRLERTKKNSSIINTMGNIYQDRSNMIYNTDDKTTGEDDDMVDLIAESSKEPQQIDFYKLVRAWEDVGQD